MTGDIQGADRLDETSGLGGLPFVVDKEAEGLVERPFVRGCEGDSEGWVRHG